MKKITAKPIDAASVKLAQAQDRARQAAQAKAVNTKNKQRSKR
jgi:hypothetical protein